MGRPTQPNSLFPLEATELDIQAQRQEADQQNACEQPRAPCAIFGLRLCHQPRYVSNCFPARIRDLPEVASIKGMDVRTRLLHRVGQSAQLLGERIYVQASFCQFLGLDSRKFSRRQSARRSSRGSRLQSCCSWDCPWRISRGSPCIPTPLRSRPWRGQSSRWHGCRGTCRIRASHSSRRPPCACCRRTASRYRHDRCGRSGQRSSRPAASLRGFRDSRCTPRLRYRHARAALDRAHWSRYFST